MHLSLIANRFILILFFSLLSPFFSQTLNMQKKQQPRTHQSEPKRKHAVPTCTCKSHMSRPQRDTVFCFNLQSTSPPHPAPVSPETEDKHCFPVRRSCERCISLLNWRLSISVTRAVHVDWRVFQPGRDIFGTVGRPEHDSLSQHIHPVDVDAPLPHPSYLPSYVHPPSIFTTSSCLGCGDRPLSLAVLFPLGIISELNFPLLMLKTISSHPAY